MTVKPSHGLIRAKADNFSPHGPSSIFACGTIESYEINAAVLSDIGGELEKRINSNKISALSAGLKHHSNSFVVEAIALPGNTEPADNPSTALAKFSITLKDEAVVDDPDLYGSNLLYVGTPDGDVFGTFEIDLGAYFILRKDKLG